MAAAISIREGQQLDIVRSLCQHVCAQFRGFCVVFVIVEVGGETGDVEMVPLILYFLV